MSRRTNLLPKRPKAGLLIFAKTPVSRTVKTRLQPPLSDGDCLDLHRALVRHTLDQMRPLQERVIEKTLFLTGDSLESEAFASVCGIGRDFGLALQRGSNLGERMRNGINQAFDSGCDQVLVAGTDVPLMSLDQILQAIQRLSEQDVILGPAVDGGYYLIGLSSKADFLFKDIDWGTDRVLRQRIERIASHGLKWQLLEVLHDLDNLMDLQNFQAWMRANPDAFQTEGGRQLRDLVSALHDLILYPFASCNNGQLLSAVVV